MMHSFLWNTNVSRNYSAYIYNPSLLPSTKCKWKNPTSNSCRTICLQKLKLFVPENHVRNFATSCFSFYDTKLSLSIIDYKTNNCSSVLHHILAYLLKVFVTCYFRFLYITTINSIASLLRFPCNYPLIEDFVQRFTKAALYGRSILHQ